MWAGGTCVENYSMQLCILIHSFSRKLQTCSLIICKISHTLSIVPSFTLAIQDVNLLWCKNRHRVERYQKGRGQIIDFHNKFVARKKFANIDWLEYMSKGASARVSLNEESPSLKMPQQQQGNHSCRSPGKVKARDDPSYTMIRKR